MASNEMIDDSEGRIKNDIYEFDREEGITGKPPIPKIKIPIDDKNEITVWLYGKKAFKITQGNTTIQPYTKAQKIWYESDYYNRILMERLNDSFDLTGKKAREIALKIREQSGNKVNEIIKEKGFFTDMSDESAIVLNEVENVVIQRCDDTNIYNIHINGEAIKLTDAELFQGPDKFCIQYLNRFLKKIKITEEEWNLGFIQYFLTEGNYKILEEKVKSNNEIVVEKFKQYVKCKTVYDWKDTNSRTGHADSVYYDHEYQAVRISSEFISKFYDTNQINVKYKVTKEEFNNSLQGSYVKKGGITGKVEGGEQWFRMFKPEMFEITSAKIRHTEPTVQRQSIPGLEKFDLEETT